jgi:uncharacterized protein (TIGR02594 family)
MPFSRRALTAGLLAAPALLISARASAEPATTSDRELYQLIFPPFGAINAPGLFGYNPATAAQKQRALEIENATPKGPRPIDIAQSFINRYAQTDPSSISQWPAPESWNPLIVDFFSATATPANNDMIAWCAAFVNWCLERNQKNGSRSASSQSFLSSSFKQITTPTAGDLAVFTCYDTTSKKTLGLGHVGFFKEQLGTNRIAVVGGNQAADGHSSIISETTFLTSDTTAHRYVGNKYVSCIFRLSAYVRVV